MVGAPWGEGLALREMHGHGGLRRPVVDGERQQLGPRVVADRIHHSLALGDQRHVEVGHHHAFAFGQRRRQVLALGRDDGRVAAAAQRLLQLRIGRDRADLLVGEPAGGVDDEAARFERVVADGHFHLLREDRPDQRAGKLRAVDLLVLRHQGVARERVVVLPAGQRTDAAHGGVDHLQARAVAHAPDHALVVGRRDLAALERERAVGVEHQLRVVEAAVVALVHAEHHHHAACAGALGHGLRDRAGHHHRALHQPQVRRPCSTGGSTKLK
jgi:hypothetical protein